VFNIVDKWVSIECHYKNRWVTPIISAIFAQFDSPNLADRKEEIDELAHAICTRLDMINYIESRMKTNLKMMERELRQLKNEHISTNSKNGCALLIDNQLIYHTLIDIDSYLFEINACCDLIGNLAEIINYLSRGDIKTKGSEICISILKEHNEDKNWFIKLDNSRNDFIHETAPYIAIDVSREGHYELLIMKKNLKCFDDRNEYITLTDLITINNGFFDSLPILRTGLIKLLQEQ